MGAETNVLAACLGTNAEPTLQVGHCGGEVGHGVNDVVNQHMNLTSRKCHKRELARVGVSHGRFGPGTTV
jgi:hypothetical protein